MHLSSWLHRLQQPQADMDYRPGHERFLRLLENFPLRRPRLRIRVAGTNGKGSTAHMIANALQACGLRTGLYTSPHILNFHERIAINGQAVDDATLLQLLAYVVPLAERAGTSPFETASALALLHFSQLAVDAEVLEAGVGARLDTLTAIEADMALITPIGLDHQAWLGHDLSSIANEKAYAMHGCRWALTGENTQHKEVLKVLHRHYPRLQCVPCDDSLQCLMPGAHQQNNASLALAAVQTLAHEGLLTLADSVHDVICATTIPGRLQSLRYGKAMLWLDAAHNLPALEALQIWCKQRPHPLDGILIVVREDRQLRDCAAMFEAFAGQVLCLNPELQNHQQTTQQALEHMLKAKPDGEYLLFGSFQTIAALLAKHPQ